MNHHDLLCGAIALCCCSAHIKVNYPVTLAFRSDDILFVHTTISFFIFRFLVFLISTQVSRSELEIGQNLVVETSFRQFCLFYFRWNFEFRQLKSALFLEDSFLADLFVLSVIQTLYFEQVKLWGNTICIMKVINFFWWGSPPSARPIFLQMTFLSLNFNKITIEHGILGVFTQSKKWG